MPTHYSLHCLVHHSAVSTLVPDLHASTLSWLLPSFLGLPEPTLSHSHTLLCPPLSSSSLVNSCLSRCICEIVSVSQTPDMYGDSEDNVCTCLIRSFCMKRIVLCSSLYTTGDLLHPDRARHGASEKQFPFGNIGGQL